MLKRCTVVRKQGFGCSRKVRFLGPKLDAKWMKFHLKSVPEAPLDRFSWFFWFWNGSFFRLFSGTKKVAPKSRKIWQKWSRGVTGVNRPRPGRGQGGGKGGGKPPPRGRRVRKEGIEDRKERYRGKERRSGIYTQTRRVGGFEEIWYKIYFHEMIFEVILVL